MSKLKADLTIPEDSKDWLAAIGLMAMYWATLEVSITALLQVLMMAADLPDEQRPKSLDMTFNRQLRLWKDCAKRLPDDLAKESIRIADKTRIARNHRDLLMHGVLYADGNKYYAVMLNSKKKHTSKEPHRIPIPTAKILKNAYETRVLTADFYGHLARVSGLMQESLRKKLVAQGLPLNTDLSPSTSGKR